jgi:hypothetical protein
MKKFRQGRSHIISHRISMIFDLFILGIFINAISWVVQKGKDRICIDLLTKLGDYDTGAPNNQIPKASAAGNENKNPFTAQPSNTI